jgi:hypothetical protein
MARVKNRTPRSFAFWPGMPSNQDNDTATLNAAADSY